MWYNPLMLWLLRSPLHGIVSGFYMPITFTGRKSGKTYTTPVEYFYNDDTLCFFTAPDRLWWRNLRDGAAVAVRVKGQTQQGVATTSLNNVETFSDAMTAYLKRFPGRAKYFKIRAEDDGTLNPEDIARVADKHVVVQIALNKNVAVTEDTR